jgi:hypothetical protein
MGVFGVAAQGGLGGVEFLAVVNLTAIAFVDVIGYPPQLLLVGGFWADGVIEGLGSCLGEVGGTASSAMSA